MEWWNYYWGHNAFVLGCLYDTIKLYWGVNKELNIRNIENKIKVTIENMKKLLYALFRFLNARSRLPFFFQSGNYCNAIVELTM